MLEQSLIKKTQAMEALCSTIISSLVESAITACLLDALLLHHIQRCQAELKFDELEKEVKSLVEARDNVRGDQLEYSAEKKGGKSSS